MLGIKEFNQYVNLDVEQIFVLYERLCIGLYA